MENALIQTYDPQWPIQFEHLHSKLSHLLGQAVGAIEHIGSNAVPGLSAKPIIDLDVLLVSAGYLPLAIERLKTLGYEHQGNLGIAGREAFRTSAGAFAHHLYVCLPDCEEFQRHIILRDYLRANRGEATAYNDLKWSLLTKTGNDRAAYIRGKEDFVQQLVARTLKAKSEGKD